MKKLKMMLGGVMSCILKHRGIRRRLAFEFSQRYFSDLGLAIPVGLGLVAPLVDKRYLWSFNEVFLSGEYTHAFERLPIPDRWIDLGCHAGFFSLCLMHSRAKADAKGSISALLIDADPRTAGQVEQVISANGFQGQFAYAHGAVALGVEEVRIQLGDVMESQVTSNGAHGDRTAVVPVLTADAIMRLLPPPYDLIKVDIEGSEHDFLVGYTDLIAETKSIIMEWHADHRGGGGKEQIRQLLVDLGFSVELEVESAEDGHCPAGVFFAKRS